jgi:hypothetical protein
MHPIPPNLKTLNDVQIEQQILKLNSLYFMTEDDSVRHQIILLLDTFKIELEERRVAAQKRQQQNGDNDLDSLIKVS